MPLDALDEFLTGKSEKPKTKNADTGGTTTAPDDLDAFLTGKAAVAAKPATTGTSLADVISSPEALAADIPVQGTLPTRDEALNALRPEPDTTYGTWMPFAKNEKTGELRWAMPNILRDPLIGLLEGPMEGATWNPQTGTYGLTPQAASVAPFAATGLRFGGPNSLRFEPQGMFNREPIAPDAAPNLLRPEVVEAAAARQAAREVGRPPGAPPPPDVAASPTGVPVTPAARVPGPDMGPAPVGAQVSPSHVVGLTPEETTIYRSTAEGQKWLEPQPVGVPDTNTYVRGINPTRVESEQSVNTARDLKALGVRHPEISQEQRLVAEEHNELRGQHYDENSGSGHDIHAREQKREADIETDKPQVFARSRAGDPTAKVDTTDLVARINEMKNDPMSLEIDPVQNTLADLLKRLVNKDGSQRITNPEQLWSLRRRMDQLTSKRMQSESTDLHYSAGQLTELKPLVDAAIEPAATGFAAMIAKYKAHSDAIDTMRLLQEAKNGLYVGSGGRMRMSYEKFNAFMRNVVKMRNPQFTSGINDFQKLTDAQMDSLWALRDDLRRSASALELARTAGSDSIQNLWDMIKGLATGPEAQAALHGFAATQFGVPGVIASTLGKRIVGPLLSERTAARGRARGMDILRPPPPEPNILNQAP